jgi:hypothetical protein
MQPDTVTPAGLCPKSERRRLKTLVAKCATVLEVFTWNEVTEKTSYKGFRFLPAQTVIPKIASWRSSSNRLCSEERISQPDKPTRELE